MKSIGKIILTITIGMLSTITLAANVSGQIQLDQTFFSGSYHDKKDDFPSGANINAAVVDITGDLIPAWTYALEFVLSNGSANLTDANVSYHGLNNTKITLGQIAPYFSLESTNSNKWIPFLKRSLPVLAFAPSIGLGAEAKMHFMDQFVLKVSAVQPKQGTKNDRTQYSSDRWMGTTRLIYSPVHTETKVYDFGFTAIYKDIPSRTPSGTAISDVRYSTMPEAKARSTATLLDTMAIQATSTYTYGVEAAGMWGPLLVQAEYLGTKVDRVFEPNVSFNGWYIESSYILTGEKHDYNFANGSFGKVHPKAPCGAWEVAARYSYLNLNDKNIHGGSEHNLSASLGWYMSENIRFLANYIRANIHPYSGGDERNLNIFGLRAQVVW